MAPELPADTAAFRDFEHRGWEQSASAYHRRVGPLTRLTIAPLLDATAVATGMKVLDVATGPGYVAAEAQRRGATVVAIDFSARMIALARSMHAGLDLRVGDAEALSFEPESFDAVVMNFGILHLAQPDQAIREAHRVLGPRGVFGFSVWAAPEEAAAFALILRAVEAQGDPNVTLPAGPPFSRFSDPMECERTLRQAGFASIRSLKVPLVWRVASAEDLFTAFFEGTARTGGLLRAQSPERLAAIRAEVGKRSTEYLREGQLSIPMPALVVTAHKA